MLTLTTLAAFALSPTWTTHVEWEEAGPAPREHASVFIDKPRNRASVYAGSGYHPQLQPLADAWAFDLTDHTWTRLETRGDVPTPGGSKRVAQAGETAYLFAGYAEGFRCNNDLHRVTFTDDALVFQAIEQTNPPPARALHALAFDPETNTLATALGVSHEGMRPGLWTATIDADTATWTRIESDTAPSPRFGFAFAADTNTGQLLVASGQLEPTRESPLAMTDEVWSLDLRADPPAWTQIQLDAPPEGRRNPCFAYDDANDRLAIWCGTADPRTNVEDHVILESDAKTRTSTTRDDDTGDTPPRRSSGFGFAHPRDASFWLGFGNSAAGAYQDLARLILNADD
ncbi:MAG: kelch repeat-containing protein [Phycisphaerales bacterium JB059]